MAERRGSGTARRSRKTDVPASAGSNRRRRDSDDVVYRNRPSRNRSANRSQSRAVRTRGSSAAGAWSPSPLFKRAIVAVLAIALVGGIGACVANATHKSSVWKHDHYWQETVKEAEAYYKVDEAFTDCVLSMIQVESSGDVDVDKYHDILQTAEGDGGKIMRKGVKKKGIKGKTPQSSIYAGVYELKLCIKDFKHYLGREPVPNDPNDLALLSQGYNYGHLGWFTWLAQEGIEEWTLEVSEEYQQRIDGLGTATHGQKVMDTYKRIVGED